MVRWIAVIAAMVVALAAGVLVTGSQGGTEKPLLSAQTEATEASSSVAKFFPRSRHWSRAISRNAKTDPRSTTYVNYLVERLNDGPSDGPFLAVRKYGVPVFTSKAGDPVEKFPRCYRYECPGLAGSSIRFPANAKADPGTDAHMVILDTKKHIEYDLFGAKREGGRWTAAGGAAVNYMTGHGGTGKITGATAAHTALMAGIIRPSEIKRGKINHAVAFTVPGIGAGPPRCPAQFNVPTTDDVNAPPEGTRFVLSRSVNVSKLKVPRIVRIIARAVQRYGMIVTDNGGTIAFRGENPIGLAEDTWSAVGHASGESISLRGLPLNKLRAVWAKSC